MKILYAIVLTAFLGLALVSCSDESQSPVSSLEKGSLEKNILHYVNSTDIPLGPPVGGEIRIITGGKIQFKELKVLEAIVSVDQNGNPEPLGTGLMEHYLSTMIDGETGEGPVHGSYTIFPANDAAGEDAKWVGTYEGFRSYNGQTQVDFPESLPFPDGVYDNWTLKLQLKGHGKGGIINGWQFTTESTLIIVNFGNDPTNYPFPMPQIWFGSGTGFIAEH